MQDMLYSGSVRSIKDLVNASSFPNPEETFVLTERLPQHIVKDDERQDLLRFVRFEKKDIIDLNNTSSGRVFDENGELRWEWRGNSFDVVYLGNERRLQELAIVPGNPMEKLKEPVSRCYYLFGEVFKPDQPDNIPFQYEKRVGELYAEVRIPRLLDYPMRSSDKPRVQIKVLEYTNKETGQIELFRFQNVENAE